ncbi:hypothetical protein B2J93_694 [Marssonina coronariae]|uniref:Uncharacterized protein n=1 Tax=Diplocarpon coronariae TaxID=2795749 RepID=A0A218Z122_9HELO|nr:hypothetical protein B2J93_694 [Marssonina coronariae]
MRVSDHDDENPSAPPWAGWAGWLDHINNVEREGLARPEGEEEEGVLPDAAQPAPPVGGHAAVSKCCTASQRTLLGGAKGIPKEAFRRNVQKLPSRGEYERCYASFPNGRTHLLWTLEARRGRGRGPWPVARGRSSPSGAPSHRDPKIQVSKIQVTSPGTSGSPSPLAEQNPTEYRRGVPTRRSRAIIPRSRAVRHEVVTRHLRRAHGRRSITPALCPRPRTSNVVSAAAAAAAAAAATALALRWVRPPSGERRAEERPRWLTAPRACVPPATCRPQRLDATSRVRAIGVISNRRSRAGGRGPAAAVASQEFLVMQTRARETRRSRPRLLPSRASRDTPLISALPRLLVVIIHGALRLFCMSGAWIMRAARFLASVQRTHLILGEGEPRQLERAPGSRTPRAVAVPDTHWTWGPVLVTTYRILSD